MNDAKHRLTQNRTLGQKCKTLPRNAGHQAGGFGPISLVGHSSGCQCWKGGIIEPGLLDELAKALKVPSEAIKNFSEEAAINVVNNTFHDFHDNSHASAMNYHCIALQSN